MARPLSGDLRNKLICEAMAQLDRKPAAEVSLRAIAREVGVTHVAAYRHFADRDALLDAVAIAGFQALHETILAVTEHHTGDALLEQAGIAYVEFALSRPHRFRSMFTRLGRGDAELRAAARQVLQLVPRLLGDGGGDPGRAVALWSAAHGLAYLAMDDALPDAMHDPIQLARAVVSTLR